MTRLYFWLATVAGLSMILLSSPVLDFASEHPRTNKAMPWIPLLLLGNGDQKVNQVAYVADEDTRGVYELFLVSSNKPGASTKLNPQLAAGGDVTWNFKVNPDGSQVAYVADQDTDDVGELYLVNLSNPGVSAKLNAPLVAGGDVFYNFAFSPDGSQVAYVADQDTDGVYELYLVNLSNPGVATVLNDPLPLSSVISFSFVPGKTLLTMPG